MATKKTDKPTTPARTRTKSMNATKAVTAKSTKGAKTAAKKAKGAAVDVRTRHPRAKLVAAHGSKDALAKTLASAVAREGQDADQVEAQLKKASNKQLLRLAKLSETVKSKWGSREKLIAAIGTAAKKAGDKDFITKLGSYSLPQLVDLAIAGERRSRA